MPARCNDAEHTLYRAGGTRRALPCGAAPRVLYLDLRRLPKLRWKPGTESPYDGIQFNGNGTFHRPLQHGEHRGDMLIDANGSDGTYTVQRTARARCKSPAVQALTCTSEQVHSSFGSPRPAEAPATVPD